MTIEKNAEKNVLDFTERIKEIEQEIENSKFSINLYKENLDQCATQLIYRLADVKACIAKGTFESTYKSSIEIVGSYQENIDECFKVVMKEVKRIEKLENAVKTLNELEDK